MAGFPDSSTVGINSLNAYDIQNDGWSGVSPGNETLNKLNRGQAMFATTDSSGLGLGFIAGGMGWVPGMITFNASDSNNISWTNTTNNVPYFWGPATEYVRFGNQGVLVSVGGYVSMDNVEQRDMASIQVYDIDSQQWFQVTASGDIPRTRSSFCSGLSSASDDSSFQMTIYGGYNNQFEGNKGVGVIDDVYVLTMPAFRWIQVTSQTKAGLNGTNSRRHLCQTYEDRQMIVLGGDMTDAAGNAIGGCNADYPPIKLLDTSTYTWQPEFPVPNGTYEVPAQVYNVIGGGPNGAATLTAPAGGFNTTVGNSTASAIFSKRVVRSRESVTQKESVKVDTSTKAPATPVAPAAKFPANHTGVIVGAVIGSFAFILGLGGLVIFLWRRQATKGRAEQDSNWQKAELPDQPPSPRWAGKRPAGFRTCEMFGDDPDAFKPRELLADCGGMAAVVPHELSEARKSQDITVKELPPLPVELPTRFDN